MLRCLMSQFLGMFHCFFKKGLNFVGIGSGDNPTWPHHATSCIFFSCYNFSRYIYIYIYMHFSKVIKKTKVHVRSTNEIPQIAQRRSQQSKANQMGPLLQLFIFWTQQICVFKGEQLQLIFV